MRAWRLIFMAIGCACLAAWVVGAEALGLSPSPQPGGRVIVLSGLEWAVKSSRELAGPGPNQFSDGTENVWVDSQGRLHLRITYRGGAWRCAEVVSRESFGYGTYRFYLDSAVDDLGSNAVLGLFTWSDDPAENHREIDIEFSRWGAREAGSAQFVVQPEASGRIHRFGAPAGRSPSTP